MSTVYRKTDKGQHEIDTRELRIPPRLRTALILVDGKRDDDQLAGLIAGDSAETLRTLAEMGLIEAIAVSAPRPARLAAVAEGGPDSEPAPSVPPRDRRAFEQRRRDAVRHLNDQIGPVGEAIAMKMEKAQDWEHLLPALQLAQQVLGNTRGAAVAAEFGRIFIDVPPP
ncbi:MAG: hypothetical protein KF788_10500 [Piscinibacter sp.]|nr:hypothetical protein [Piscinibacter sp.]